MSRIMKSEETTMSPSIEEKALETRVEQQVPDVEEPDERYVRKIVHKIDRRLVSITGLLFAISLLDRANVANANIAGMSKDLELSVGTRYSLIVLIFFAPYVIAEIPGVVVVRRFGPRWTLPGVTLAWGVLIVGFGFVTHWTHLVGLRIILGVLEGLMFPGLIYLVSLWYTRYEVHKRYSAFSCISSIGSAFGGILAYLFMKMQDLGGLAAWRWIFIMEGLLTVVVGAIALVFLIDYPQNAHKAWWFLSKNEADIILRRLEADRSDTEADQVFEWGKFLRPALDWRVWGYGWIYTLSTLTAYAVSYFMPMILKLQLGFSTEASQLLTTPPYIFGGILMCVEGWLCDRWRIRSPVIIYNSIQSIVGLCIMSWTKNSGVQYLGVFLVSSGSSANFPAVMAWQANNIRGHWTRSFCSALLTSMGGLGGIIGALVFRSQDAPTYTPGVTTCILSSALIIVLTLGMTFHFHLANKQIRAGRKIIADHPGFEYTL
ncbi:hypothetical protein EMPG_13220 [Blastomyces silverae]|uniref:Major facilitator superfamily (MFS) profile domain-containing protein n=1 Tax=Blastomyces silverae TaxID=2060906 RepID=A0A0H1BKP6_9EURO|nr:hypothetical protein EMPG_13220 [Blastomyces silverae]